MKVIYLKDYSKSEQKRIIKLIEDINDKRELKQNSLNKFKVWVEGTKEFTTLPNIKMITIQPECEITAEAKQILKDYLSVNNIVCDVYNSVTEEMKMKDRQDDCLAKITILYEDNGVLKSVSFMYLFDLPL